MAESNPEDIDFPIWAVANPKPAGAAEQVLVALGTANGVAFDRRKHWKAAGLR